MRMRRNSYTDRVASTDVADSSTKGSPDRGASFGRCRDDLARIAFVSTELMGVLSACSPLAWHVFDDDIGLAGRVCLKIA